ncbi:MAG: VCBS repeat-containing protein [Armatimonadia bacterium]|nr:VCBS repeat-containing protein [Armatimonadia bacterium]
MVLALIALSWATSQADLEAPLAFERQRIGTATFEAASVFDVDRDGHLDILSGEYWYAGPDFEEVHKITEIMAVEDYYDDFSDYPMDVNGDGYKDIVTGGWWGGNLRWLENPAGEDGEWTIHVIDESGPIERCCFYDIDGDGDVEVFPVTAPVLAYELDRSKGEFIKHVLAEEGGGGHGIGFGDLNGDGNPDIVFAHGWLEAPDDPFAGEWTWHPDLPLIPSTSVPILVHDVNEDGLADLIVGAAHDYGLYWYEQSVEDGERVFTQHVIDADRSQYHDLMLADLDKDGEVELVTGKRYRAHQGHDPGGLDPLGLYYFEIGGGDFERYTLDYGPVGEASGAGIYMWIEDVDGNGWPDIVAPGKEGLYLFKNLGPVG